MERSTSPLSEKSTLVNFDQDPELLLNRLSPFFLVNTTKYGGRGCFAYQEISLNELIFSCKSPTSSSIVKPFKKEVCTTCFQYNDGKTLKYKLSQKTFALYFCTPECLQQFVDNDVDDILTNTLLNVEKYYQQGLKKGESTIKEPPSDKNLMNVINEEWNNVEVWENRIKGLNQQKIMNNIPVISEDEYLEIKYALGILFQQFKYQNVEVDESKFYHELSYQQTKKFDLIMFDSLQSSYLSKVEKYPYLIYSYINIYKFIRVIAPPQLHYLINPQNIQEIIGKNLTNAFGIWSTSTSPSEEKEFFGFGVYPCASYFNHSCDSNIIKIRVDNKLEFRTKRKIQPGEELCIDYGNHIDENVEVRQAQLKEWFFDCACTKCILELNV